MIADPNQSTDIALEKKDVATSLTQAVTKWRQEMFGSMAAVPTPTKGKEKKKGERKRTGGFAVDNRPYPIGFVEFPMTPLPARDGVAHGGVKRSSSAPNCSYFVNWKSPSDSITWDVEVNTTGEYDVAIYYTCPERDAGSVIELGLNGSKLTGKVSPGWDPPLYTNQDTLPRPAGESQMKPFRPLPLGTMRLERGRGLLTLRAVSIPGDSVMDVRLITLTLKDKK
jgi:hypothetical protein